MISGIEITTEAADWVPSGTSNCEEPVNCEIATGTVLRYLDVRFPEHPWRQQYPNLVALSARLEARPSFAATVPVPQVISDKVV